MTWTAEGGQVWSLTGRYLAPPALFDIAGDLDLRAGKATWPGVRAAGYAPIVRLSEAPGADVWNPIWHACYEPGSGECRMLLQVNRFGQSLQAAVTTKGVLGKPRLVTVGGRAGFVDDGAPLATLLTTTSTGLPARVSSQLAVTELIRYVEQSAPLA